MDLKCFIIVLLTLLSQNSQALVAKDALEEDVASELHRGAEPWLALVVLPGGASCSGAIVSPTSVLSAAVCLKNATRPAHGVAYAGNVKYTLPKDFDPPTQNRSVVEYHLYDDSNTLKHNIMLVKIAPRWIWSISVQPVGIIDLERLPDNFTSSCLVSGLGAGDRGSSQVARSASALLASCSRSPQPHDQLMCSVDPGFLASLAGDVGGPVLCESKPAYKLYGIISEHSETRSEQLLDPFKIPSRLTGFEYVGYYMSWINRTAGDLPSNSEIKSLRMEHADEIPLALQMKRLHRAAWRRKKTESEGSDEGGEGPPASPVTESPTPSTSSEAAVSGGTDVSEGAGGGNGNDTAGSGAGRVCSASSLLLLAAPLALAVRALY